MLPPVSNVLARFRVDAQAGRVYWANPPKQHPRLMGREAGSLRPTSDGRRMYCYIKHEQRAIKRANIIFAAVNGRWPSPMLDHRNGDSTDDRIANLREATKTQNNRNQRDHAKKAPLPAGVRRLPGGQFQARVAHNGKSLSLGTFITADQAAAAYQQKRRELYGEFIRNH